MIDFKENRNVFDDAEPSRGHDVRFKLKLEKELHQQRTTSSYLLKIAASIVLLLGVGSFFYFTQSTTTNQTTAHSENNNSEDIKLHEAEYYYKTQFDKQFAAITKTYHDNDSKLLIKQSQLLITDLEKEHQKLNDELIRTGDYRVATAMILNHKSRISILETLIEKLKYVSLQKNKHHEKTNT